MAADLWRITVAVTPATADLFEAVVEPHCDVLTRFVNDEGDWRLEGLAAAEPDEAWLRTMLAGTAVDAGLEAPVVWSDRVESRDWVAENLQSFAPVTAGRYYIHGSHVTTPPPAGCRAIEVDAGAAFGSGEHPTTKGCLLALETLAHKPIRRPLDMGCGSGVLALGMARTWPVPVLAVDNDPRAVQVARANARLNGLGGRVRTALGGSYRIAAIRRRAPLDLIVANILANPLCAMARGLAHSLDRRGYAVLSGFLDRDGRRVEEAHRRLGLRRVRRLSIAGWQTLVLRKG